MMDHLSDAPTSPQHEIPADIYQLWAEAEEIWEAERKTPAFAGYVSGDFKSIYASLLRLHKGGATTFLEWGSGLGVATIMASRICFDAYGIEIESRLVDYSESFAETYEPDAQFAHGSFVPDEFEWDPSDGSEVYITEIDTPSAYAEFDMELRDFDVVYAFPWPTEHGLFRNIMRQFGSPYAALLSWDATEGLQLIRFNEEV